VRLDDIDGIVDIVLAHAAPPGAVAAPSRTG